MHFEQSMSKKSEYFISFIFFNSLCKFSWNIWFFWSIIIINICFCWLLCICLFCSFYLNINCWWFLTISLNSSNYWLIRSEWSEIWWNFCFYFISNLNYVNLWHFSSAQHEIDDETERININFFVVFFFSQNFRRHEFFLCQFEALYFVLQMTSALQAFWHNLFFETIVF